MKVFGKLKEKAGVTIGEMLLSVLIMSFLTLAVSAGVGTAAKVYRSAKTYSESRLLANSLLNAVTEEVRYASGAQVETTEEGTSLVYDSSMYGADTQMRLEKLEGKTYGKLAFVYQYRESGGALRKKTVYPFEETTYGGYWIQEREDKPLFSQENGGSYVEVAYDICNSEGSVKASLEGVKIRLLNGDIQKSGGGEKEE